MDKIVLFTRAGENGWIQCLKGVANKAFGWLAIVAMAQYVKSQVFSDDNPVIGYRTVSACSLEITVRKLK